MQKNDQNLFLVPGKNTNLYKACIRNTVKFTFIIVPAFRTFFAIYYSNMLFFC